MLFEKDTLMSDGNGVVETGVDALLKLVKEKGKISVADAAHTLRISESVIQNWVDFLIEEEVLGIEYKFITPYIYLNEHSPTKLSRKNQDTMQMKEEFFAKARSRNLPAERINILWKQYVTENLMTIKEEFLAKAKDKGLDDQKAEAVWNRYKMELLKSE